MKQLTDADLAAMNQDDLKRLFCMVSNRLPAIQRSGSKPIKTPKLSATDAASIRQAVAEAKHKPASEATKLTPDEVVAIFLAFQGY